MTVPGEVDLRTLLRDLQPELDERPFVYVSVPAAVVEAQRPDCLALFREVEGVTLVLAPEEAARLGLATTPLWARITLTVHSSLLAVGLLARVAAALAGAGISCNAIAAYHHDHLFVPWPERERALNVLRQLGGADA